MNRKPLFGLKLDLLQGAFARLSKEALAIRYGIRPNRPIELSWKESPHQPGLRIIEATAGPKVDGGLIVGSVRMGYGHHRMAYSVSSWAIARGETPYLHDLLAIDSPESKLIRESDDLYSFLSRLASEWGGPVEWAWGMVTMNGDLSSLQFSTLLAEGLRNLITDIKPALPLVSSYPLNGQMAVAAGFRRVVHLVPDNHPQYYLLVPGALNLVQSNGAYAKFIQMGVPAENLAVAGHWVSHDIAVNAEADSRVRMERLDAKKPVRVLFSVGGAGAQKSYLSRFIQAIVDLIRSGQVHLWVNAGDHAEVADAVRTAFDKLKIGYSTVESFSDLQSFCNSYPLNGDDPPRNAVVFHFSSHYEAFTATDLLIRRCDLLSTKPGELAFFPVPKLFAKRVGDHEAASAVRSMELGEGTAECRSPSDAAALLRKMISDRDLLRQMSEAVIQNAADGIYNGSKTAVDIALSMKDE